MFHISFTTTTVKTIIRYVSRCYAIQCNKLLLITNITKLGFYGKITPIENAHQILRSYYA